MKRILNIFRDETGATAAEYGLIVALVCVASIVAVQLMGSNLNIVFMQVARELNKATQAVRTF